MIRQYSKKISSITFISFNLLCSGVLFPFPADSPKAWVLDERDRMLGYRNSLSRGLEKKESSVIKDSSGLNFRIDKHGRLAFDPNDDNWKVRTFVRSEAPFHMSEAEKFYKIGAYEEALSIWKAAQFLLQIKDPTEHERAAAELAAKNMNQFRERHVFYSETDEATEPAVLFDDNEGRTHIFSGNVPLHVILPGAWSYMRPKNKFSSDYRAVYLRHREHELTVTWEIPKNIDQFGDPLENFVHLWDYRQSLDERIKRTNNFMRKEISVSRCSGKKPGKVTERCAAYEAEMRNMKFYQFFLLKNNRGIYMIYKNPDPKDAKNVISFIAEKSEI